MPQADSSEALSQGQKGLILFGLICILLGLVLVSLHHLRQNNEQAAVEFPAKEFAQSSSLIAVHVIGAVQRPNVYWLPARSRVIDAINAAGGLRSDADPASVNLAAYVEDGQQIRVASLSESIAATSASSPQAATQSPLAPSAGISSGSPTIAGGTMGTSASSLAPQASSSGMYSPMGPETSVVSPARKSQPNADLTSFRPISLSTASRDELMKLPKIGPSLANNILYYRARYGPFRSVDDLAKVPGFGPERIEAIRPYVTP